MIKNRYQQRPVRFLEILQVDGWKIKLYSISVKGETVDPDIVALAMKELSSWLYKLIIPVLSFISIQLPAQPSPNSLLPKIDQRVELFSLACRLANINGFSDSLNPPYTQKIEDYFRPYAHHPFIELVRARKNQLDTMYWEIPALAIHLSQPPALEPLPDQEKVSDDLWDDSELLDPTFVMGLQRFYVDSKCETFFNSMQPYYNQVNQQYVSRATALDREWIKYFFGVPATENYYAIIALGIRNGAYLRVNFKNHGRSTFTIFGCTEFNETGLPATFSSKMFYKSMLHEYIHAFTNQLIDRNSRELRPSAEKLLRNPEVFKLVENTFYGNWQYLLYESMVRASAIKYMAADPRLNAHLEDELAAEEKAGFFWIRGLVKELDRYEANRKTYKNLDDFMPEITTFFRKWTKA